jgi:uncharacterized membrane protein
MRSIYPIENIPLFSDLPPALLLPLQESAERHLFQAGEMIFRQGDLPQYLYVVEEGEVDIVLPGRHEELIVASFEPGSFFGELAVLDNEPRSASARASAATSLICLPLQPIAALLDQHPGAARRFLRVLVRRLRGADELLSRVHIKNVNEIADERMTVGERVADQVARFGGSWTFILCFGAFLLLWAGVNTTLVLTRPPDPYPYIFLNLILSCIAALQAPVIMMSQNRQAKKDRLQADQDYQVNIKAEFAVQQLHRKLDELRAALMQRRG